MPAIRIKTEPKRPPPVDPDEAPRSVGRKVGEFLSGRAAERREKRRQQPPRNMVGRRG